MTVSRFSALLARCGYGNRIRVRWQSDGWWLARRMANAAMREQVARWRNANR